MGLHFSKEEFASRKSKVKKSMIEQNVDALLMFRQESMYWLTGYDSFGYVFFQALVLHRISHKLWNYKLPLLPRVLSQLTRNITGIEIHPGATIGREFLLIMEWEWS